MTITIQKMKRGFGNVAGKLGGGEFAADFPVVTEGVREAA
jgi:hypothetical protein